VPELGQQQIGVLGMKTPGLGAVLQEPTARRLRRDAAYRFQPLAAEVSARPG